MTQATSEWSGHVIVCGLHDEGLRVVEQLHAVGVPVVVVDPVPDHRLVEALRVLQVPYVAADAREPATLATAGLAGALALVCAESDDLQTLATALLARELRPELRVVVQLRNAAVGRALADVGVAVLDVARLTAPSVVEACLRSGAWTLRLGAESFRVVETTCLRPGRLRDLYGDLAPIAVVPAATGRAAVAPGRDTEVEAGDTVVVVGTPDEIGDIDPGARRTATAPAFVGARAPRPPRAQRSLLRDLVADIDRRIKLALLALLGLIAASMTMLLVGYEEPSGRRMTPLDALYFTVETIGTVGYGDFYFRDQHPWLRLWAICLMVVGATLATVFFALLTNALIGRRIEETLGRRRITGLDGHVIVVGVGSIGVAVVDGLRAAGTEVVAVDGDEGNRFLGQLREKQVPVVTADATLPETLASLRLDRARAVAVMTSDDLANLEAGLAVRDLLGERWPTVPVVLRLFDQRLADTVATSFDFRFVRSPAALAAPWFVGAALGLDVIDTFYVGDRPMLVARLDVRPGSGLDGLAMRDLAARILVVSLVREGGPAEHKPRRDTRFAAGDTAFLVGPYEELLHLLRTDAPSPARRTTGDVQETL
ncbi:NAD-binding protein [Nocardioides mangrovi]|uniref:NAD-binding protein n=1 Tax=Nocardioides mangrovi TaxID=2874580 RepID=A0ABS7UJW6_9ACTN|nr:potassium channel protein [Nocardioides mangrovi]MBZ5741333.1 NAD-binding protein [Nocardioides mangrovi]